MIVDFSQPSTEGQAIVFPDWAFSVLPKQAADIKETVGITGGSSTPGGSITGTSDQAE